MNWFSKVLGGSLSTTVNGIANVVDRFIETPDEKAAFKLEVETLLQKRDAEIEKTLRTRLKAKERILVAELNQGDNYTKRARPTVVYAGLLFIAINYVIFPLVARLASAYGLVVDASPLADLPTEFWVAWGGICATWSIGRSMEKRGIQNKTTKAITGNKSILD